MIKEEVFNSQPVIPYAHHPFPTPQITSDAVNKNSKFFFFLVWRNTDLWDPEAVEQHYRKGL